MGLFELLWKRKDKGPQNIVTEDEEKSLPDKAFAGTMFEREVVTFEQRKKTTIPSQRGLYIPEILMLHFCKNFPNPARGCPRYWWYQYGISNVDNLLQSLEERGFIFLNEETGKYTVTDVGQAELDENAYVLYMHQHSKYTDFTVWDLNQMLGNGDKSHYMDLIEKRHAEIEADTKARNDQFMAELKKSDPKGYRELKAQDDQIEAMQAANEKYEKDKDLDSIIEFWEKIWSNGGPIIEGSGWMFKLPDLYIKAKRYDEAIALCEYIKQAKHNCYSDKADKYIEKIKSRQEKSQMKTRK